jgi:hypothetical protein
MLGIFIQHSAYINLMPFDGPSTVQPLNTKRNVSSPGGLISDKSHASGQYFPAEKIHEPILLSSERIPAVA